MQMRYARARGPTDRPTDRPTARPTDERTDGQTESLPPFGSNSLVVIIFPGLFSLSASPRLPGARGRLFPSQRDRARSPSLPLSFSLSLSLSRSRFCLCVSASPLVRNESRSIGVDNSTSRLVPVRASTAFFVAPAPPFSISPSLRFLTLSRYSRPAAPFRSLSLPSRVPSSLPGLLVFSLSPDPLVTRSLARLVLPSASFLFLPSALECRGGAGKNNARQRRRELNFRPVLFLPRRVEEEWKREEARVSR